MKIIKCENFSHFFIFDFDIFDKFRLKQNSTNFLLTYSILIIFNYIISGKTIELKR